MSGLIDRILRREASANREVEHQASKSTYGPWRIRHPVEQLQQPRCRHRSSAFARIAFNWSLRRFASASALSNSRSSSSGSP